MRFRCLNYLTRRAGALSIPHQQEGANSAVAFSPGGRGKNPVKLVGLFFSFRSRNLFLFVVWNFLLARDQPTNSKKIVETTINYG